MTSILTESDVCPYYYGGISEFVSEPSELTFSFLAHWFTGSGSIGRAMEILQLPHTDSSVPLLMRTPGGIAVDLHAEESALYTDTVFSYARLHSPHETPTLRTDRKKIFRFRCIRGTLQLIWIQSNWVAQPEKILTVLKNSLNRIPEECRQRSRSDVDGYIETEVLPIVLAIGFVSEFISRYLMKEYGRAFADISRYISDKAKPRDWLYQSIADMAMVSSGKMTLQEYLASFGLRSDNDYELTSPRWYEIPETIRKRLATYRTGEIQARVGTASVHPTKLIDVSIELTVLRSRARRMLLVYVDQLRQSIPSAIGTGSKSERAHGSIHSRKMDGKKIHQSYRNIPEYDGSTSGCATPVSRGEVAGNALHIESADMDIPGNTIGIFPNASPMYSVLYTKCAGLIFLRGAITSHGAIVAREFGIPAIIYAEAGHIPDFTKLFINGATGTWNMLEK